MWQPDVLSALHAALAALADPVDGWLLFDFRGLNPVMAAVVGPDVVGSRRAYVYVPRDGTPVALVHAVDAELWRAWPPAWRRVVWVRREELARELTALVGGRTVAIEYSPGGAVPYGDYVPAGTLELVRRHVLGGAAVTEEIFRVSNLRCDGLHRTVSHTNLLNIDADRMVVVSSFRASLKSRSPVTR